MASAGFDAASRTISPPAISGAPSEIAATKGQARQSPVRHACQVSTNDVVTPRAAATEALKKAKPGTPEFRVALRDALQSGKDVAGTNAVYRFTPTDHYGVDERARVMVVVKDGAFRLAK